GSFKFRDTVTDATSGPASATFGTLTGGSGFSTHNSETISGSSPYDSSAISWTSASGSPTLAAHGTDAAGNSQTDTTFTLTLHNTAPTGGAISLPPFVAKAAGAVPPGKRGAKRFGGGTHRSTPPHRPAPRPHTSPRPPVTR